MYKVMIVDDEAWVVENYRLGIDWASQGFEVAAVASNGIEALEKIRQMELDLVVTDVRMPMMGGLELIRIARKQYPNLEFAIISGYAEFSYAQKALNYGVAGYCLKPLEDAEVHLMLSNVRERLKKRSIRSIDYFSVLEEMMNGGISSDRMMEHGIAWDAENGMRAVLVVGRWHEMPTDPVSAVMPVGVDRRICFVSENDLNTFLATVEGKTELNVGVSRRIEDTELINSALMEAQLAAGRSFLTGTNGIHFYQSASCGMLRAAVSRLAEALEHKDAVGIDSAFDSFRNSLAAPEAGIRHAYYVYSAVTDILFQYGADEDGNDLVNYQEMSEIYASASEMLQSFRTACLRIINYDSSPDVQMVSSEVVRKMLKYMHENYSQDISLHELADRFYLNPSYLCRTFKKQVGKPFTVYLAGIRLKKACELLNSSSLTVYEIADRCGYKDYFYFARLFKKFVGVTPSQYRQSEGKIPPVDWEKA